MALKKRTAPLPASPAEPEHFTVDFMSDMHADAWDGEEFDYAGHKKSDIAIVAGDLADGTTLSLAELKKIAAVYKTVLFVDGNHEFRSGGGKVYNFDFEAVEKELRDGIAEMPNVVYLRDKPFVKDGVAIIGRNGHWDYTLTTGDPMVHDIPGMKDAASAFKSSFIEASRFVNIARRDYYALRDQVMKLDKDPSIHSIVVVTHTVPRKELLAKFEGMKPEWQARAGAGIMNNLLKWDKNKKIKAWICGHQHTRFPWQVLNGVKYVNNPRAKKKDNTGKNYTVDRLRL